MGTNSIGAVVDVTSSCRLGMPAVLVAGLGVSRERTELCDSSASLRVRVGDALSDILTSCILVIIVLLAWFAAVGLRTSECTCGLSSTSTKLLLFRARRTSSLHVSAALIWLPIFITCFGATGCIACAAATA